MDSIDCHVVSTFDATKEQWRTGKENIIGSDKRARREVCLSNERIIVVKRPTMVKEHSIDRVQGAPGQPINGISHVYRNAWLCTGPRMHCSSNVRDNGVNLARSTPSTASQTRQLRHEH